MEIKIGPKYIIIKYFLIKKINAQNSANEEGGWDL